MSSSQCHQIWSPSTCVRNFSESLELVLQFGVIGDSDCYARKCMRCNATIYLLLFFGLNPSRWDKNTIDILFFHSHRSTSLGTRYSHSADYVNDEHHFGLRVTIILPYDIATYSHRIGNKIKWFYFSHAQVHVNLLVSAGSGGLCSCTQHTTSMWIQISTF